MAGIYDRIGGDDNVNAHDLFAVMILVESGDVNGAQALSLINGLITDPLDAASVTDLGGMGSAINALAGSDRDQYVSMVHAISHLKERGVAAITETVYRNRLGI